MNTSKRQPENLAFVLVKAFGDLTIAASVIRRMPAQARTRCALLIAPHLVDLANLLSPGCEIKRLDIGKSLPALFDIRRSTIRSISASAFELRRALAHAQPGATLVFDRLSYRERFVAGRRDASSIVAAPNVYLAYEEFLALTWPQEHLAAAPDVFARPALKKRIGLFPFSRVATKNIPCDVAVRLARRCEALGFEPVVFLLEGEEFETIPGVPVERLARRFDALAQGISSVDAIASADSLPAHLGEYVGRPVFVAMPRPNAYYAPRAAFAGEHWALFSHTDELSRRFDRFVRSLP